MYDLTGKGANFATIPAPPQKQVNLTAPSIAIQHGASVNVSGGGDLYANEFVAASSASINPLDPTKAPANTYAIIPGLSGFAPYDPQSYGQYGQATSNTTLTPQLGKSVYLAGGNGIAAGYYTLLPANYALLPGAYRVTAVSGYSDMQPGLGATSLADGSQIMAGKFAVVGTNIQDSRYSGFQVTPGSVVRGVQSQYNDSYANTFFAAQTVTNGTAVPRLPVDAGQLVISAVGSGAALTLEGSFNALPGSGGRGSLVDLNGPGFDIVSAIGPANGLVQLTASELNSLGAESLLIGGVRTQTATGMNINVSAGEVIVGAVDANGTAIVGSASSALTGPELILAANNAVTVKAGSKVSGSGTFYGQTSNISIGSASVNGDGALLRVSSAAQVSVTRTNLAAVPVAATLTVENGATVGAQNAVMLDSSYATSVGNNAVLSGQSLSVAAQSIDVGANSNPAATSLALGGALLTKALSFNELILHSYNGINFYGSGNLDGQYASTPHALNNLVLNSSSLNGFYNAGTNSINATSVTLTNTNTSTDSSTVPSYSAGNLTISGDQINIAGGSQAIQGFDTVKFNATKQIVAQGTSSITLNAEDTNTTYTHNLVLQAGQITGANSSSLTIAASNEAITINPVAGATASATSALNAKLSIFGKSIDDYGIIDLPSGSIALHATGSDPITTKDSVTLESGSITYAKGLSETISGQTVYAQAGKVALTSANGGVGILSGALVDVSGASAGGNAGSINIVADNGEVTVAGSLQGIAATNYAQGSFTLDSKTLNLNTGSTTGNALTDLNNSLSDGSFTTLRDIRVRTGNLTLDPGTVVQAQTFNLTADTGTIDVYGTINASGNSGGNILLAANGNVTLESSALLDAHATVSATGGNVTLETTVGQINMMSPTSGTQINVAGSVGTGGTVMLRALQNGSDVNVNNIVNTGFNISSGANVTVEAYEKISLTGNSALNAASYYLGAGSAIDTFMTSNANAIKTRLGVLNNSNMSLVAGLEIDSTGDLSLGALNSNGTANSANAWDLSQFRFNDGNGNNTVPVILTLRAAGNLNLNSSLSDGFTSATNATLKAGQSSSYRLVAGADMNSANVMGVNNTVASSSGNVVLAPGSETTNASTHVTATGTVSAPTTTMEMVRTGTGFIDVAAGGNIVFNNRDSVIYTAGQEQATSSLPSNVSTSTSKVFAVNGGNINLFALGDIDAPGQTPGTGVNQLVTEWQFRQGVTGGTSCR